MRRWLGSPRTCTEADVAIQHFGEARDLGMETVGFLMLAHRASPEVLARNARTMVDAGTRYVYVVDSAGALVLSDAQQRVQAVFDEIGGDGAQVGFPGHQNRSWGSPTRCWPTRRAPSRRTGRCARWVRARATQPRRCSRGLSSAWHPHRHRPGRGAVGRRGGRSSLHPPGCPGWTGPRSKGYAGVYSSFMLSAERAAERYGVPAHERRQKVVAYGYLGGQEDLIIDIALQPAEERSLGDLAAAGVR